MLDFIDYRTLTIIFILKSMFQAIAMFYVWQAHRKYQPAHDWAVGSLLIAFASVLLVALPENPHALLVFVRNLAMFAGLLTLSAGIIRACGGGVQWRLGITLFAIGAVVQIWLLAAHVPEPICMIVFSLTMCVGEIYVGIHAWRSPCGPMRRTQILIGCLLFFQAATALLRSIDAAGALLAWPVPYSGIQTFCVLMTAGTTFLLALSLVLLTSEHTNALLEATLSNLEQGVAMFDRYQRLIICNKRYAEIYRLTDAQVEEGTRLHGIVSSRIANGIFAGEKPETYLEECTRPIVAPVTRLRQLSDGRSISIALRPMPGGGWLSTHTDVSEIQRIVAQLAFMAHHDTLTGLANRPCFLEKLNESLERLKRYDEPFCIMMIDLDHFKTVNDSLGHPSGDLLLQKVAERLRSNVRESDIVARLGGDEFAILLRMQGDRSEIGKSVQRLFEKLEEPCDLDGQRVMIGACIGVAMAPENGMDADQLVRNADLALYRAKSEGRNGYRFYDSGMDARARARHALELDLRKAHPAQDFILEYQPIFDACDGRLSGAEALVRWRHPSGRTLQPAQFIGIAEDNGFIVALGTWILRQACKDAASWPEPIDLSVNLSAVQLADASIIDIVSSALAETGLPPSRLELEVTESVLMRDLEGGLAVLHQLTALGVKIALDDFGTGYSSLNYLTMFPFNRIKIDKSFVNDIGGRTESTTIVTAMIALARSLSIATTAEGVETENQYELLRLAGCTQIQGYLFGQPKPVDQLFHLMKQQSMPLLRSA